VKDVAVQWIYQRFTTIYRFTAIQNATTMISHRVLPPKTMLG
jgi:hypothetical protein